MNRKNAKQLLWAIMFMVPTYPSTAEKVVIIPLGADTPTSKKIFRTSERFTGNLGGISGADEKCQIAASAAGIAGTYKAWLGVSTSTDQPSRPEFKYHDLPYTNVDGTPVAQHFVDLFDGKFVGSIKSETMTNIDSRSWTGMLDNGVAYEHNCNDWVNGTSDFDGGYGYSNGGTVSYVSWSGNGSRFCSYPASVLCFEQ